MENGITKMTVFVIPVDILGMNEISINDCMNNNLNKSYDILRPTQNSSMESKKLPYSAT